MSLALVAQLSAPLFHLGHQHRFCAEHQSLEEAGPGPAAPRAGLQPATPAESAHVACGLVALSPTLGAAPGVALAESPYVGFLPQRWTRGGFHPPLSILAQAPKLSPPAQHT